MNPVRLTLTLKLMEESGLLDRANLPGRSRPASEEDLLAVHTAEYLAAVRDEQPDLAFGLGSDDTSVFPGICSASRLLAGGSIDAAYRMIEEDCRHALQHQQHSSCHAHPGLGILCLR